MYGKGYVIIVSCDGHSVALPRTTVNHREAWLSTWSARDLLRLPGAFAHKG